MMGHWEYKYQLLNDKTPTGRQRWRGWQPTIDIEKLPLILALGGNDGFSVAEWRWNQRRKLFTIVSGDGMTHLLKWVEDE